MSWLSQWVAVRRDGSGAVQENRAPVRYFKEGTNYGGVGGAVSPGRC